MWLNCLNFCIVSKAGMAMDERDYLFGQEDATRSILAIVRERMWNNAGVAYSSRVMAASSKAASTRRMLNSFAAIYEGMTSDLSAVERSIISDAGMSRAASAWYPRPLELVWAGSSL